ncbi:MAG: hypothetical protein ABSE59_04480, partial [Opitutaceae bacterium]
MREGSALIFGGGQQGSLAKGDRRKSSGFSEITAIPGSLLLLNKAYETKHPTPDFVNRRLNHPPLLAEGSSREFIGAARLTFRPR